MKVFVTGGTGFVGSAVIRHLLHNNLDVITVYRKGANLRQLKDLKIDLLEGELTNLEFLKKTMNGCQWVFHVAALYAYWGFSWEDFVESNVHATRVVMEASQSVGVKRVVHTSTIAVLAPPQNSDTADENTPTNYEQLVGYYKRSKFLGEKVVQEFVAKGLPAVIVNPCAPIGEGDWKPTATGKMIVDYLNGKMPAYVESHQNMVDVDDVAIGHVLAAQKGRIGERYILGGQNLTLKEFLDILSQVSGLPPVKVRMPFSIALAWSYVDTTMSKIFKGYIPQATPDAVRIGKLHSYYDFSKAVHKLGYRPRPVIEAVQKAVTWYRANGYVSNKAL